MIKSEYCLLSNNILDYHVVAQGKTTIPHVDDGEEFLLTDVRHRPFLILLSIWTYIAMPYQLILKLHTPNKMKIC